MENEAHRLHKNLENGQRTGLKTYPLFVLDAAKNRVELWERYMSRKLAIAMFGAVVIIGTKIVGQNLQNTRARAGLLF